MKLQELIDRLNHVREVARESGFEGSDLEVMFERGNELVEVELCDFELDKEERGTMADIVLRTTQ